jgi:hypothetical protein
MNMEKQLALFKSEQENDFDLLQSLPPENRQGIEALFAELLLRSLGLSLKEVDKHEK